GKSFNAFYEDRLLAESYIYKLSDHLYQKKIMLDNCSSQENKANLFGKIKEHNAAIGLIIQDYEKTKLTPAETSGFLSFKHHLRAAENLE
ncbi:MCP four helix bundle domain-containing protein, partial [Klebsiella pneumoniae]|nr:MCP four helix bundle domain-containing protein [Klebsiella pneumoniae]